MKTFLIIFTLAFTTLVIWSFIGMKSVNKDDYISPITLDISKPLDVTINVDFIKGLNPANGQ